MNDIYRAYSVITERSVAEDKDFTVLKGIATTPTTDRVGDIVEPMGAKFKTPMPLLWQHRHSEPVGNVVSAKAGKNGIPFEAHIPHVREAGRLKDRIDEAIQSVKYGLVLAVSIGFRALGRESVERMEDGGYRFKEWEWLELSLVTIPANSDAVIQSIKSIDSQFRQSASSGLALPEHTIPGDPGQQQTPQRRGFFYLDPKRTMK